MPVIVREAFNLDRHMYLVSFSERRPSCFRTKSMLLNGSALSGIATGSTRKGVQATAPKT